MENNNINLLDLDNDILNIIGGYVKKDNDERQKYLMVEKLINEEQILNGKKNKI